MRLLCLYTKASITQQNRTEQSITNWQRTARECLKEGTKKTHKINLIHEQIRELKIKRKKKYGEDKENRRKAK